MTKHSGLHGVVIQGASSSSELTQPVDARRTDTGHVISRDWRQTKNWPQGLGRSYSARHCLG